MRPRDRQRLHLVRAYGALYSRHLDAGVETCFYCGEKREVLDHRPCLAVLDVSGPAAMRAAKVPLVLLPSCWDCNSRLGSRELLTAQDAAEWLREKLEKEYERRATLWSKEEEKPMSKMFKRIIRAKREAAEKLVDRVRFLQLRVLDEDLMPRFFEPQDDL